MLPINSLEAALCIRKERKYSFMDKCFTVGVGLLR